MRLVRELYTACALLAAAWLGQSCCAPHNMLGRARLQPTWSWSMSYYQGAKTPSMFSSSTICCRDRSRRSCAKPELRSRLHMRLRRCPSHAPHPFRSPGTRCSGDMREGCTRTLILKRSAHGLACASRGVGQRPPWPCAPPRSWQGRPQRRAGAPRPRRP